MQTRQSFSTLRSAFTLIEVVTSLAIMTVLLLGLSGAFVISAHAIPTPTSMGEVDQQIGDALNQLRIDMQGAYRIKYKSGASEVQLIVDMTDTGIDGCPGKITYTYTLSTDILTRKIDAMTAVQLVSKCDSFTVAITQVDKVISSVRVLMTVEDSLQRFYEMHAVLPYKPELK